jgi:hypothetical protein
MIPQFRFYGAARHFTFHACTRLENHSAVRGTYVQQLFKRPPAERQGTLCFISNSSVALLCVLLLLLFFLRSRYILILVGLGNNAMELPLFFSLSHLFEGSD